MFHLSAYTVLIGTTADTDVPAVTDDILTVQNNHYVLSQGLSLLGAMVMSATLSRAKLASPSMRQVAPPFIRPTIVGTLPGSNANMDIMDQAPFAIPPFEEVQMQGTSAIAMGTERFTGLIWLSDGIVPAGSGNIYPLRWTSVTAAVANAWTTLTVTFADTLPSGVYQMVLSEHQSTNSLAHRWIFPNQLWRPGYSSIQTLGQRLPDGVAKSQFGVMGRFRSNDLPRPQVLCNAADASHEGYIHCQRIGNLAG